MPIAMPLTLYVIMVTMFYPAERFGVWLPYTELGYTTPGVFREREDCEKALDAMYAEKAGKDENGNNNTEYQTVYKQSHKCVAYMLGTEKKRPKRKLGEPVQFLLIWWNPTEKHWQNDDTTIYRTMVQCLHDRDNMLSVKGLYPWAMGAEDPDPLCVPQVHSGMSPRVGWE
jgi:hypothetical protein